MYHLTLKRWGSHHTDWWDLGTSAWSWANGRKYYREFGGTALNNVEWRQYRALCLEDDALTRVDDITNNGVNIANVSEASLLRLGNINGPVFKSNGDRFTGADFANAVTDESVLDKDYLCLTAGGLRVGHGVGGTTTLRTNSN